MESKSNREHQCNLFTWRSMGEKKYIGIDNQTNIINIPRSRHRTNQHKPRFGAIQSQENMLHSNSDFEYLPQNS